MSQRFKSLLPTWFGALTLLAGSYQGVTKGQQPDVITLLSSESVIETVEPISGISSSEDGRTLYVVSSVTGDVDTYGDNFEGLLRPLGKTYGPIRGPRGSTARVGKNSEVSVSNAAGRPIATFKTYPADSLAFLGNGNIVVASPTRQNLLHIYSPTGQLLRSFGTVKQYLEADEAENLFLQRGKVLVDANDNIFYVSRYVPLIQKFLPGGELLYSVQVRGAAIDLQEEVAQRFFSIRKPQQVGGIEIITSVALDRTTGHLWLSMNGSSLTGVLYEYDGQGGKLREYALQTDPRSGYPIKITGVRDIAVANSRVYVLTPQNQIHSFGTDGYPPPLLRRSNVLTLNGGYSGVPAGWSLLTNFVPARQTCPPAQPWGGCAYNCPGTTCQSNGQPTNTSSTSVSINCKAALQESLSSPYNVQTSSCNQFSPGTMGHMRGGCMSQVTICKVSNNTTNTTSHSYTGDCPAPPTSACQTGGGGEPGGCDPFWCEQFASQNPNVEVPVCCMASPVLVDVSGNGFNLTDGAGGVNFDLNSNGAREGLSWTAAGSDDAWLALDRDGNGTIDNGQELFGNFTPQPASENPNGFIALAEFDKPENGGNADGFVNRKDAVFTSLRLWQDTNHNGTSEPGELRTLPSLGVARMDLDYKESRRRDQHGNAFGYRAKVKDARGAQVGRWAWDVFLVQGP